MEDAALKNSPLIETYIRARRRAVLVAVAACGLAGGVIIGVALPERPPVRAGNRMLPAELSSAFVEIARQVEPAVVNISTVSQPAQGARRGRGETPEGRSPLDILPFGRERNARRGNGSGVIVDAQGYVLTNHHVIEGADRIRIKLYDGTELPGKVIGSDAETDLAVVKIESPAPLAAARLGDSDQSRVGDWVLAIGSPFGLDQTVTAGIISAKDREANELSSNSRYQHFLQTDAAINRGNSGGPLINLAGEVIGINTAIATSTGDYNGIGFALPSTEAVAVYSQLLKQGRVVRGFLGVYSERVTPQIARVYRLPSARGAIITNVSPDVEVAGRSEPTPAVKAGLRPLDVIVEFRGQRVKDELDLIRRVAAAPVGASVPIKFFRDGQEMATSAVIGRRVIREEEADAGEPPVEKIQQVERQAIGINIAMLTPQQARAFQLDERRGVLVVSVEPGSIAEDAELKRQDIIETINREPVATAEQFQRLLDRVRAGEPVVLQVYRQTQKPPRRFISFNKP